MGESVVRSDLPEKGSGAGGMATFQWKRNRPRRMTPGPTGGSRNAGRRPGVRGLLPLQPRRRAARIPARPAAEAVGASRISRTIIIANRLTPNFADQCGCVFLSHVGGLPSGKSGKPLPRFLGARASRPPQIRNSLRSQRPIHVKNPGNVFESWRAGHPGSQGVASKSSPRPQIE